MKLSYLSLILLILLASCSRKSEKELYDEGREQQEQKNFQLAIERFQEVVEKFPQTAYAETSQYLIAIIYNNDLHDTRKAVTAYQKFYTLFPLSAEAPNALFLTGFLYNNELHNIDSARIAYEAFLQRYPAHALAVSAKFEVETLGKDPTQVLQLQAATESESKEQSNTTKQ